MFPNQLQMCFVRLRLWLGMCEGNQLPPGRGIRRYPALQVWHTNRIFEKLSIPLKKTNNSVSPFGECKFQPTQVKASYLALTANKLGNRTYALHQNNVATKACQHPQQKGIMAVWLEEVKWLPSATWAVELSLHGSTGHHKGGWRCIRSLPQC